MPTEIRPRRKNANSYVRTYLITVMCGFLGAGLALFVSRMESESIHRLKRDNTSDSLVYKNHNDGKMYSRWNDNDSFDGIINDKDNTKARSAEDVKGQSNAENDMPRRKDSNSEEDRIEVVENHKSGKHKRGKKKSVRLVKDESGTNKKNKYNDISKKIKDETKKKTEKNKKEKNTDSYHKNLKKDDQKTIEKNKKPKKTIKINTDYTTKQNPSKNVTRVMLLGERHSGTNWITSHLTSCFPTLLIRPRLVRWKHWFQHDDNKSHNPTLVISQFRNAYEWVWAMRRIPHHAPHHLYLPWKEFVTKPWTMPRPLRDVTLANKTGYICNQKFRYHELVSCVQGTRMDPEYVELLKHLPHKTPYSGHSPIYELKNDGSGEAYDSLVDLRADKIKNFLFTVKEFKYVVDSVPVRYEELVERGTDFLLSIVEQWSGVTRECTASPPREMTRRNLTRAFVDWITDNVDWETEELIGYKKWGENHGEEIGERDDGDDTKSEEDDDSLEIDKRATKSTN